MDLDGTQRGKREFVRPNSKLLHTQNRRQKAKNLLPFVLLVARAVSPVLLAWKNLSRAGITGETPVPRLCAEW
jgi:hypothetical protein